MATYSTIKVMCGTAHPRTPLEDWLSNFAAVRPGGLACTHQLVAIKFDNVTPSMGQVTMPHDHGIEFLGCHQWLTDTGL